MWYQYFILFCPKYLKPMIEEKLKMEMVQLFEDFFLFQLFLIIFCRKIKEIDKNRKLSSNLHTY